MISTAYVKIWNQTVGAVAWNENNNLASFEYDPSFEKNGWKLAPIKMPYSNRIYSFPELRKNNPLSDTFKGLPGLLADALPDKYGNQLINSWLAKNGRPMDSLNPVEMLCFIGNRGMGALEFEPTKFSPSEKSFQIEIESLVDIAQQVLNEKTNFKTTLNNKEKELTDLLKIGTSAGGARPKAIIAYNPKTQEVRSGQTSVPKGFGHWIIKLDAVSEEQFGTSNGYGRIEMAYYNMAKDCEIDIMESTMFQENGRAHFMTRRFDREVRDIKHHIQTFCAIQHLDFNDVNSFSYEQLFQTMRQLRLPYPQATEMYRRMVFNVYAKNCDDHTKNFSFRLKQNQLWELAPAYDLCHAYRPDSPWVSQHALGINGKRRNITDNDLIAVAKAMNIKRPQQILYKSKEIIENWPSYAEDVGVPSQLRDAIGQTLFTG